MNDINRYFDNGATSFPKPKEVADAIHSFVSNVGGTYSRSSYSRVVETTAIVEDCRDLMLEKFGAKRGYICWSANSTDAVNMLINGLNGGLEGGVKNVLISTLEHNAVARVLVGLNIKYTIVPSLSDGTVDLNLFRDFDLSQFDLAIICHQSNVNGVVQPIKEIKQILGTIPLLVDASQSMGERAFLADDWCVDYAVFTAHKGLMGITGLGGFFARDLKNIKVTRFGGTGSNSDSLDMPTQYPDNFQVGTPNIVSIVALHSALMAEISPNHTFSDFVELIDKIKSINELEVLVSNNYSSYENQGELFSVRAKNMSVFEFASKIYSQSGIECRAGLHCATLSHQHLGTIVGGSVRFSLSPYHTIKDLDYLCNSIINVLE